MILTRGRVYTFSWPDPGADGTPAAGAPHDAGGWRPDGEVVAVRDGRIILVGSALEVDALRGGATRVLDLEGATVLPGIIDSHTHLDSFARRLVEVDLVGVADEEEAVERVVAWKRGRGVPDGAWIVGYGWDDGAWADRYPTAALLSERLPSNPVFLRGLHGFAVWGNRTALSEAGIDADTPDPEGGTIVRDGGGRPTGILRDRATALLAAAVPEPTPEAYDAALGAAFDSMTAAGITAVGEGDVAPDHLEALERLERAGKLSLPTWVWLHTQGPDPDTAYLGTWLRRGPDLNGPLRVRTVKAFYDGALGSRGAWLLDDYSDAPGMRGTGGEAYGFSRDWVARMARAGFQVAIHAIGDAANRGALDFFDSLYAEDPAVRGNRNRIEHAQVLATADLSRFAELDVAASMQPQHAMDDMPWAEDRLGPERIRGAYAWRSLRRAGARLIFSSDLPGADWHLFPSLHAAVTRRDLRGAPEGGWYPDQTLTPEEALRAYTVWAARSVFSEADRGTIEVGKRADLTVTDLDPLAVSAADYEGVLGGRILLTVVEGRVVFDGR
ncbi:MAG TPA: amidohydrolase [Longimicrobiales bacterium]|nr:amidohydrolase [Longimicrobiales bacterium]